MPIAAQNAREGEEDNGDIPPVFSEELTLREMKASFKSNKGALTRLSFPTKSKFEPKHLSPSSRRVLRPS